MYFRNLLSSVLLGAAAFMFLLAGTQEMYAVTGCSRTTPNCPGGCPTRPNPSRPGAVTCDYSGDLTGCTDYAGCNCKPYSTGCRCN